MGDASICPVLPVGLFTGFEGGRDPVGKEISVQFHEKGADGFRQPLSF
jgi:hypothetical protein